MAEVLVTGASGTLGRRVVERLLAADHAVRTLSRHPRADGSSDGVAVIGDLGTGAGLDEATIGVDAIVHCASATGLASSRGRREVDVHGTRRLLASARRHGSPQVIYPSIVGIDGHPFSYYRVKRAAEQEVERSGLPWAVQRTTQFHDLILLAIEGLARPPVMLIPRGFRFQPVAVEEVADRLLDVLEDGARGRLEEDLGGPEVLRVEELARSYLDARGRRRRLAVVPMPGRVAGAFREGRHLCTHCRRGSITWSEFLEHR